MARFGASVADLAPAGALAIVAPHPDDETLGCGGLIALAAAQRRAVVVVAMTDGSASHPGSILAPPGKLADLRSQELRAALSALGRGRAGLVEMGLADGCLDRANRTAVAARLGEYFQGGDVGTIFVTGPYDTHPDHRGAFDIAAMAAARLGAALWTYPVRAHVGRLAPRRGAYRLAIHEVLDRKRAALGCFATQLRGGVPDAPEGFHLSDEDLAYHLSPHETFIAAGAR